MWFPWPFNLIQGWLENLLRQVTSQPWSAAQWLWGSVYPQFDSTRLHATNTATWLLGQVLPQFGFLGTLMQNTAQWLQSQNNQQFYLLQLLINQQFAGLPPLLNYGWQWITNQFGQRFDLFGGMMQGWLEALLSGFSGSMGAGFLGGFQWLWANLFALPSQLLGFFNVNSVNAYAQSLGSLQALSTNWILLAVQELFSSIINMRGEDFDTALASVQNVVNSVVRGSNTLGALNCAAELLHPLKNASFEHLFGHAAWAGIAIGTLESLIAPLMNYIYEVVILPAVRYAYPYLSPSAAELVQMRAKELIDPVTWGYYMGWLGYNLATSNLMLLNTYRPLDIGTVLTLLRRGEIHEDDAKAKLQQNLLASWDAELQLKLRWIIPGVEDLIRFVVREVIAPEDFYNWAEKQGLSRFWSQCYWDAHWVLPAMGVVVDAYHRGAITKDELEKFLVWHDYSPVPRPGIHVSDIDIVRATQKTLFTRVDARYAYEFGLWDFSRLIKHFRDLGYEEDAMDQALVQVSRTLTEEKGKLETQAIRDYREGYITAEQLVADLEALGLSPERVELRLQLANRQFEADYYDELKNVYIMHYRNDLIDEDELNSALAEFIINPLVRWVILEREKARKYAKKRA